MFVIFRALKQLFSNKEKQKLLIYTKTLLHNIPNLYYVHIYKLHLHFLFVSVFVYVDIHIYFQEPLECK